MSRPAHDRPELADGVIVLRPRPADPEDPEATGEGGASYDVVVAGGAVVGRAGVTVADDGSGTLSWRVDPTHVRRGIGSRALRLLVDWALTDTGQGGLGLGRVSARVDSDNGAALRTATRAGLRREGVARLGPDTGSDSREEVLLGRVSDDPPLSDPSSFRTLLNSFLPRKRAIAQMLVRDEQGRVLMCQLTYKRDWDLPGGVVEVGESPRDAVSRELEEELGLQVPAGRLLLTDWLPPWSGWDDALCLVFDGGTLPADTVERIVKQEREIRDAQFLTPELVRARATDFTARRVEAALEGDRGYTESGR